jgi:hypothetical protein
LKAFEELGFELGGGSDRDGNRRSITRVVDVGTDEGGDVLFDGGVTALLSAGLELRLKLFGQIER